jgi:serine/threonine protein kinase
MNQQIIFRPPPGLLPRLSDFELLWQLSNEIGDGGQGHIFSTKPTSKNKYSNINIQFVTKIISISSSSTLQCVLKCYLFVQKHKLLNIYGIFNDIQNNRLSHELDIKYLIDNQKSNSNLRFSRPGFIYIYNESSIKLFINQIAKQLDIIHSNNCIHFDLKPENIMYDSHKNKWNIIDYDLMKIIPKVMENNGIYLNHYRGTMCWTSPEMSTISSYSDPSFITTKTDIFSFGLIILYIIDIGFQPYLLCQTDIENVHWISTIFIMSN